MNYCIREMKKYEYPLLNDFLYEAIFIPKGVEPPPKSIIAAPELQIYIDHFGDHKDDHGLVAEVDGKIAGAVWAVSYTHLIGPAPSAAQKGQMSIFSQTVKGLYGTFRNYVIPVPQRPVNIKKYGFPHRHFCHLRV